MYTTILGWTFEVKNKSDFSNSENDLFRKRLQTNQIFPIEMNRYIQINEVNGRMNFFILTSNKEPEINILIDFENLPNLYNKFRDMIYQFGQK